MISNTFLSVSDFKNILRSLIHDFFSKKHIRDEILEDEEELWNIPLGDFSNHFDIWHDITGIFSNMFSVPYSKLDAGTCPTEIVRDVYYRWSLQDNEARSIKFYTSGSTGTPKICCHTESEIRQEIYELLPHILKPYQILVTVPFHHLYGFTFGIAVPRLLSIPSFSLLPLPTVLRNTVTKYDTLVSIPFVLEKLAKYYKEEKFTCMQVITGTMPLDPKVGDFLQSTKIACLEIYGSSETGVIGIRKSSSEPFTLQSYFSYKCEDNILLRCLNSGKEKEYPLMDNLQWLDTRHFFILGRSDRAVQVGGINVYPERVEEYLNKHPCIAKCTVRLSQKDFRLKAFIVLQNVNVTQQIRKEIREYVKNGLSPAEQPVVFDFGEDLPRNDLGKIVDW